MGPRPYTQSVSVEHGPRPSLSIIGLLLLFKFQVIFG